MFNANDKYLACCWWWIISDPTPLPQRIHGSKEMKKEEKGDADLLDSPATDTTSGTKAIARGCGWSGKKTSLDRGGARRRETLFSSHSREFTPHLKNNGDRRAVLPSPFRGRTIEHSAGRLRRYAEAGEGQTAVTDQ